MGLSKVKKGVGIGPPGKEWYSAHKIIQVSYSNKEIKIQYIPGSIELNFQDISDAVYQTISICIQIFVLAHSVAHLVHIHNKINVL